MKRKNNSSLWLGGVLGAALAFSAPAQENQSAAPKPMSTERTILVTVTAKVEAIDQSRREVTLKGPLGNVVTFVVDERVKRLNEFKVGDEVTADYYVSLAGELRAPTKEEKKKPLIVVEGAARAPKDASPAGRALRAIKVVATIEGLDLPTRSVTLKGPMGNLVTVRAASVDNLKKLRLGDTIAVTYTEALAISLQKTQPGTRKE